MAKQQTSFAQKFAVLIKKACITFISQMESLTISQTTTSQPESFPNDNFPTTFSQTTFSQTTFSQCDSISNRHFPNPIFSQTIISQTDIFANDIFPTEIFSIIFQYSDIFSISSIVRILPKYSQTTFSQPTFSRLFFNIPAFSQFLLQLGFCQTFTMRHFLTFHYQKVRQFSVFSRTATISQYLPVFYKFRNPKISRPHQLHCNIFFYFLFLLYIT